MLISFLMSRKSRTKSSRSDMRTLYRQQEFRLLNLSIFIPHILFKTYILKVTSWCKDGCQISCHHICITESKNEGRWVAWGEGDCLYQRKSKKYCPPQIKTAKRQKISISPSHTRVQGNQDNQGLRAKIPQRKKNKEKTT